MDDGRRILRMILNICIPITEILLVCFLVPRLLRFFMPFVIGWLISLIAYPLVQLVEKHLKLVRKHSSVLIVAGVLAIVIFGLYFGVSAVVREFIDLYDDLPGIYEAGMTEVQEALESVTHLLGRLPEGLQTPFLKLNENLGGMISNLMQKIAFPTVTVAGNVAKRIPGAMVNTVVVILSSYFFIAEREKIHGVVRNIMPDSVRKYLAFFKKDVKSVIGGYFLAQFRIMFIVAAILTVGFWILGVKYGVLLAVLIAVLDFLPVFGTGTALFPWAAVKLLSGEAAFAAGLILLYCLTQVIRQIIQPKIMGDSIGLSPLLTLVFLYLGFKYSGLSGMILAVPVGMVAVKLYHYGAFDSLIQNCRMLIREIDRFRREDK